MKFFLTKSEMLLRKKCMIYEINQLKQLTAALSRLHNFSLPPTLAITVVGAALCCQQF